MAEAPKYNGRLSDIQSRPELPYRLYTEEEPQADVFKQEAIRGHFQENPLSNIFFSRENINALQQGIRYRVYQETEKQHIIGNQSEAELQIVMRSVYLQYSKNLPFKILEQVRALNKIVLDYAVPQILAELRQYQTYIKDISTLPVPMERSKNVSKAGSKFLFIDRF